MGGECPQLLDLIPNEKGWLKRDAEETSLGASEEKKLELRLAPPGAEEQPDKLSAVLSSTCFSKFPKSFEKNSFVGAKRGFLDTAEPKSDGYQQDQAAPLNEDGRMEQCHERRVHASSNNGALVKNCAQTRTTSSPVVGWPPIRSFRKNIAAVSTKQSDELRNGEQENASKGETSKKGLFVKINVDGIPIGRKVDLNVYDNYQKLSSAVEELFSGLLAASGTGITENERMAFRGLLDGSGEFTLVYEDNEGDRMLAGDVPWDMFVSTAKRLRVLKNSELSALFLGALMNKKRAAD